MRLLPVTLAAACLTVVLAGCSRHQDIGANSTTGMQRIYTLSPEEADGAAHGAIVASFPGRRIETINGPIRGYSTYTRNLLDTFTQQVMIKPVTGRRPDGTAIDGYTFEVSGSGTAGITGGIANANFASTLRQALEGTGKGVDVASLVPRAIALRPTTANAEVNDTAGRLRALRDLLDQGLVSGTEYEAKRREILGRI